MVLIQQKLIKEILTNLGLQDSENDFDKFEYWTHIHSNEPDVVVGERVIEVSDSLTWHQNKDEKLFRKRNVVKKKLEKLRRKMSSQEDPETREFYTGDNQDD